MATVEELEVQTRLAQMQGEVRERDQKVEALQEELRVVKGQLRGKDQTISGVTLELEAARARVATLETQKGRAEQELKLMAEDKPIVDELLTVHQMAINKGGHSREGRGGVLPDESLDTIVKLENTLKLANHKTASLQKDIKLLEKELKDKGNAMVKLEKDLEAAKAATGWTKSAGPNRTNSVNWSVGADGQTPANRIKELEGQVATLQNEARTNKDVNRKKTKLIETMSKELDGKKKLQEDILALKEQLRAKEKELKDRNDEMVRLNRMQKRESKLRDRTNDSEANNATTVKILEGDKRFLESEIRKHTEQRRQQDRVIRAQQIRIEQLRVRLDGITSALKDTNLAVATGTVDSTVGSIAAADDVPLVPEDVLPRDETVPVELYRVMQKDNESLRSTLNLKDTIIMEKDANVEALEKKVEVLAHSRRSEARQVQQDRREMLFQIEDLKAALEETQRGYSTSPAEYQ